MSAPGRQNDHSLDLNSWMDNYTDEDIKDMQRADSDIRPVLTWLETAEPSQADLFLSSPATKYFWLQQDHLMILLDILYHRSDSEAPLCLVIPSCLRDEALRLVHDSPSAGHMGIKKTLAKLQKLFFWYRMAKDCTCYVKACTACNKSKKPSRTLKASLGQYHAGYPMERLHVDILGPFTPSHSNNVYILMMCCQFTKWLECAAIPNQSAETVALEVLKHFIATFGCPLEIHSDQGQNFQSGLFLSLCKALDVAKTRTTPYRPCSNGQIERQNRKSCR